MRALLFLSVLALAAPAWAQVTARVVMTTDRAEVPVGGQLRLQVRADVTGAEMDDVSLPSLQGFVVRGRQVSRPMQFRLGFGGQQQMVQSTTIHTLTLEATRAGRFEFEPARVTAGGQTFQSDSLTVVVGGSTAPPQGQTEPAPDTPRTLGDGAQYDPVAFLRTVVSDTEPYVGQQIEVTLYLYTRTQVRMPHVTREPGADGFWVHDLLPPSRTLDASRQVINGVPFDVYVIRRFAAFPLRAGELTISAPEMRIETGSLLNLFNGGGNETLERTGVPLTIEARPLPEPVPAQPLVGSATIETTIDRAQARTGDAVTVRAVVRGSGNLRDVRFRFPEVPGLRALEPTIDDQVEQPNDIVGGSRTFEWLVVPEQPGSYRIPALVLHAFDVTTGRFTAVRGAELELEAAGNAAPETTPSTMDTASRETSAPATEESFGPIRTRSALSRLAAPWSSRPWFLGLLGLFPLAFVITLLIGRWRKREIDPSKENAKLARRRLDDARRLASDGEARAFYAEIARAIQGALEARLGEAVGGLTHGQLRSAIRRQGMDEELAGRVLEEFESCDFARFSSAGASRDEMDACLTRTRSLLSAIDAFDAKVAA